jgi:hypothetical protein
MEEYIKIKIGELPFIESDELPKHFTTDSIIGLYKTNDAYARALCVLIDMHYIHQERCDLSINEKYKLFVEKLTEGFSFQEIGKKFLHYYN